MNSEWGVLLKRFTNLQKPYFWSNHVLRNTELSPLTTTRVAADNPVTAPTSAQDQGALSELPIDHEDTLCLWFRVFSVQVCQTRGPLRVLPLFILLSYLRCSPSTWKPPQTAAPLTRCASVPTPVSSSSLTCSTAAHTKRQAPCPALPSHRRHASAPKRFHFPVSYTLSLIF